MQSSWAFQMVVVIDINISLRWSVHIMKDNETALSNPAVEPLYSYNA